MNKYQELVTHLENLKRSGKKQATLDIDWLLGVLTSVRVQQKPQIVPKQSKNIEVDGGGF